MIFILYTILYIIATLGIFTIALLVLARQRAGQYRYFSFFAMGLGLWLLLQFITQLLHSHHSEALLMLKVAVGISSFFAVFFYVFTKYHNHQKITIWPHLILPSLFLLIGVSTNLVIESATITREGITVASNLLYTVQFAVISVYALLSVISLIIYLRHLPRKDPNWYRTRLLIYGVLQALLVIGGTFVFFPSELIGQLTIPITSFIMVGLFAYAIAKHRLFDIRLFAIRILAYTLALLVIAVIYGVLVFGAVRWLLGEQVSVEHELIYLLSAIGMALTFQPLKRFFDAVTRAIFYQDAYEAAAVLDQISSILTHTTSVEQLTTETLQILQHACRAEFVCMVLMDGQGAAGRIIASGKCREEITSIVPQLLAVKSDIISQDGIEEYHANLFQDMQQSNVAVASRLATSRELVGFLIFGYKVNGRIYSNQDFDLIKIAADSMAVAIQNALRFEEIQNFNKTLQHRIDEATTELREKNRRLRALDIAKDEFISMASHQLRTPLTSVKGYISMVLDGDGGPLKTEQRKLLGEAYGSSQRMVYLIADFLNVSRIRTGKFVVEPKPVRLTDIIKGEIRQLAVTAENRGLKLEYSAPDHFPTLMLDEEKTRQVIMNFIDNAIYYTPPGGKISVTLTVTNKEIAFKVTDTGIGIPKHEQHKLFTKFYRASNARQIRPDGTGIGLFLAKKVITLQEGAIIFESKAGRGSIFGFRFPRRNALPEEHIDHPAHEQRGSHKRQAA